MAYQYFTKQLLAKSNEIDLATVFSDKQERAKERLNTNYSLPQIVDWIKESTNNFRKSEGYFIDLDQAIRRLVFKYYDSTSKKNPFFDEEIEEVEVTAQPRVPVEVTSKGVTSGLPDIATSTDKVATAQDEVASLQEAIDYLKDEAEAGDEEAKEALEYLKDELATLSKQI
jgi:hypothetical protein